MSACLAWLPDWLLAWPAAWLAGWLAACPPAWLLGCWAAWLAGWLARRGAGGMGRQADEMAAGSGHASFLEPSGLLAGAWVAGLLKVLARSAVCGWVAGLRAATYAFDWG